jgi:hypothetical protein
MPRLDRTGPAGRGPMTGWGRGLCNPSGSYGPGGRRGFFGPGYGWGRGRGWRGRAAGPPGWGRMYARPWGGYFGAWEPPYGPSHSREDEVGVLRQQASALKEELEAIERRITGLAAEGRSQE